jgi:hypothetical protein
MLIFDMQPYFDSTTRHIKGTQPPQVKSSFPETEEAQFLVKTTRILLNYSKLKTTYKLSNFQQMG